MDVPNPQSVFMLDLHSNMLANMNVTLTLSNVPTKHLNVQRSWITGEFTLSF